MKIAARSHAATRRWNFSILLGICALAPIGAQCVSAQVDNTEAPMKINGGKLPTRWAKDVSPTHPLPEYPRPQMVRKNWMNLNGPWNYALSDQNVTTAPTNYAGKILVPFPYEAALSGAARKSIPTQKLWYQRTFNAPANWKNGRVLLHFDAVNYDAQIWLNGKMLGTHQGGFDAFSFDVSDALKPGANELVVSLLIRFAPTCRTHKLSASSALMRVVFSTPARPGSGKPYGSNPCRELTLPT